MMSQGVIHIQKLCDKDVPDPNTQYKVINIYPKKGVDISNKKRICEVGPVDGTNGSANTIIKSHYTGTVKQFHVKKGDIISVGCDLVSIEECCHPTLLGSICVDCGITLEDSQLKKRNDGLSMEHTIPDLKVTRTEAEKLAKQDIDNLLKQKKLVLLVDLDQTLVHTTNDDVPPNLKDVFHFKLNKNGPWYHTRLRSYTNKFLENMFKLYELHICTFGVREYAHHIAHFLDPTKKYFGQRILSRNECLDPMSKKANLMSLFPCGDNMVVIIDDRTDVWNFAPNVVQVLPYHYFRHTGDINAPKGLQKNESDDTKGIDFSDLDALKAKPNVNGSNVEDEKMEIDYNKDKDVDLSTPRSEDDEQNIGKIEDVESSSKSKNDCEQKEDVKSSKSKDEDEPSAEKTTDIDDSEKEKDIALEKKEESTEEKEDSVEVPDNDDYLLYLEDILIKLHENFFKKYDPNLEKLPDLKEITPEIRSSVLAGVNIVFSGVVPQHVKLRESKAYFIATSLGATVSERLVLRAKGEHVKGEDSAKAMYTTHMVAANQHTEKVHHVRKHKSISLVTPNWLWACAERWECCDERLFPLNSETESSVQRVPPIHCYSLDPLKDKHKDGRAESGVFDDEVSSTSSGSSTNNDHRKRTPSGTLLVDENPLFFMSKGDRLSMSEDVDEALSAEDDESSSDSNSDDDQNSEGGNAHEEMLRRKCKRKEGIMNDTDEDTMDLDLAAVERKKKLEELVAEMGDDGDELPSVKFRRGGGLPSDVSDDSCNSADGEGNWTQMGEDLERELQDFM